MKEIRKKGKLRKRKRNHEKHEEARNWGGVGGNFPFVGFGVFRGFSSGKGLAESSFVQGPADRLCQNLRSFAASREVIQKMVSREGAKQRRDERD